MLSSSQNKEISAKLVLIAFHEGVLDSAQLRRCIRIWLEQPETDLATLLTDEFEIGSSTLDQLSERLAVLHPPHETSGPHLSFDDKSTTEDTSNSESLSHAHASASSILAQPSMSTPGDDAERLGDEELAKSSKRGKSKSSGRPTSVDYYDSVHERFTRDDRLIPYLLQTAAAYRRKLVMDMRRSWRSIKSLIANFRDWLKQNWRNALIATVALFVFVPACIFLSQFISPNASKNKGTAAARVASAVPEQEASSALAEDTTPADDDSAPLDGRIVETPTEPGGSAAGMPSEAVEDSLEQPRPPVTPEDRVAAIDRALSSRQRNMPTEDAPQSATNTDLSPAPPVMKDTASFSPTRKVEAPDRGPSDAPKMAAPDPREKTTPPKSQPTEPKIDKAEQLQLALQRGSELLKRRQWGRASVILKNARIQLPDSKELGMMLIISQLASKAYDDAGTLLAQQQLADADDPVWQMLFAVWLLEAPESSRSAVRGELLTLASLRPPTDIIQRSIAWIDAREGKGKEAASVLASKPIFGERSFADALFFCAALSKIGNKPEARNQLQYAKTEFGEHERTLRTQSSPDSPSYYAAIMASPKVAATINSFAAKLR